MKASKRKERNDGRNECEERRLDAEGRGRFEDWEDDEEEEEEKGKDDEEKEEKEEKEELDGDGGDEEGEARTLLSTGGWEAL